MLKKGTSKKEPFKREREREFDKQKTKSIRIILCVCVCMYECLCLCVCVCVCHAFIWLRLCGGGLDHPDLTSMLGARVLMVL